MSRGTRVRATWVALPLTWVFLAGCQQDPEPAPEPEANVAVEPTCVSAQVDGTSFEVTIPSGFTDASDGEVFDQFWTRPDDAGSFTVVGLDGYERNATDADVVRRAMTLITGGTDNTTPGFKAADRRVRERGLTEVSWTAPNRVGDGRHQVNVSLAKVGDARFTVALVASPDEFDELRRTVLPTAREGDCS